MLIENPPIFLDLKSTLRIDPTHEEPTQQELHRPKRQTVREENIKNKNKLTNQTFFPQSKLYSEINRTFAATASDFLTHKVKSAIEVHPRLSYQQSEFNSQHKQNQSTTSLSHQNVNETLFLANWFLKYFFPTLGKKSKSVDKKSRGIQKKADLQVLSKSKSNQLAYRGQ